ncbi:MULTISPECIES: helix-turn-helix transcriptional regulator [Leclercia]|uniref:Response regulator transcription factor n=1 Tax=Leclercia pneumoniae TaxID=2815358 RepID=A0ABX8JRZ3_9ENTR|nr:MULTISPECIES: response regulator transcription factor [Leclercia]KGB02579.1 bacterial regulatory s, luxR family protein [Enterobacteriaceae bacterium ATCC 29904]MBS0853365.1 response regulator transcription factor [Enterobacter sp. JGM127]MCE6963895.1 response regulator transcription factor [Enterobacter sp. MW07]MCV2513720.1 response regulator transcription factor [Leclercia pneumoniae]QSW36015.1 response regulator transcription factor [Leclercia pneumoniae]
MTPISCQHAIIISKLPVMQTGLGCIISRNLPDYEVSYCRSQEELTLLQLRRANVVIADISGDQRNPRRICEEYYSLQNHYRDIHWIFLVSRRVYPCAVELLLRPESSLLSDIEPIEGVINAIRGGSQSAERISQTLLKPELEELDESRDEVMLTHSERKVLRLLGKGWGINQIAALLKKSNKTVSAQKNSAMRRLSLRSNAEMYAWINSNKGMKELNLFSAYGEQDEWKRAPLRDLSLSSKSAQ